MKSKAYYILLLSFLCCYGTSSAKRYDRRKQKAKQHILVQQIKQYEDSLRICRQLLEEAENGNDSLSEAMGLSRMLSPVSSDVITPLTFYHGVSRRLFGLDTQDETRTYVDNALMRAYILHPELVKDTQTKIKTDGDIVYKPTDILQPDVDMTSQSEEPEELLPSYSFTPDNAVYLVAVKPNFWSYSGDYSLNFLQNYVSGNWYKGGESSYSAIGIVTLQANFNDKEKIKWDNKLEMKLGMQSSQGDTLHTYKSSEDLIRLTTKLGVQATKKWYYTLQGIFSTQFTKGYKANDETVYSDFMSPFNANLSLGMDYKLSWFRKRLTGTCNISPLSVNMKYVGRLDLASRYSIGEGNHTLWDYGSTFTADLTWKFSDLMKWQTRLYGFTSYRRSQVEWENTITFQLSKYISTKIFVYPRFDDSVSSRHDSFGYFQLKEYWSLGLGYSL